MARGNGPRQWPVAMPRRHAPWHWFLWGKKGINACVQPRTTPLQRDQFAQGIQAYLDGDWMLARDSFDYSYTHARTSICAYGCTHVHARHTRTHGNALTGARLSMDCDDAPAKTLLEYMSNFNFQAPPDWKGFRPLTSK